MSEKDQQPVVQKRKDRRHLFCKLTEAELAEASDDLARYLDDAEALEAELATIKSQYKAKLEQCQGNIQARKRLVRDKREMRAIDVETTMDFTNCTLTVVRLDTGEVIENRALTGDEKQLQITFSESDQTPE